MIFAVVKIGGSCASRAPSNRNDAGYSESVNDSAYNQEDGKVTVARNSPTQAFNPDCVIDNDNWFDGDEKRAGQDYRFFYDELGIQPYIVINGYIDSVGTDAARTSYAVNWYNENLHDSDTLLVMYFAEQNPNDVGYFAYAYGDNVRTQLEALEPLLDEGLDAHYFDDVPSAEMFRRVFRYVTDRVTVS